MTHFLRGGRVGWVLLTLSVAAISAPETSKTLATSMWPFSAAACKAVRPCCGSRAEPRQRQRYGLGWHISSLAGK